MKLSLDELRALRLSNLGLLFQESASFPDIASIVSSLGAVQAQDYPGTLWALGLRQRGLSERDVQSAIESGSIVRTWPMRGTLHFVAAADLRWMVKLLTPRVITATRTRQAQLELDPAQFSKSQAIMRRELAGGRFLTREALLAAVNAGGISTEGGRSYHLLFRAAMDQVICNGPNQEKQLTFALLEDWVPVHLDRGLEGEAAIAELTWRYYSSHGPALAKDFAGWSGLSMKEVKTGLAANKDRLESVKVEDEQYWWAPQNGTVPASARSLINQVHLLPGFDEYVLGYKNRSAILAAAFANRICSGSNGIFSPTVVIGGQIRGTWKKTVRKGKVTVAAQPFTTFSAKERAALSDAVQQYGEFYGLAGELVR